MTDVPFVNPRWEGYPKHRRMRGPSAEGMWERSELAKMTGRPGQPAQYDPNLTDPDIHGMEMGCIARSELELTPRRRPHVREFYGRFPQYIGASEGKKTKYIYVEYHQSGAVHGRPVTGEFLKKKGVVIDDSDEA